MNKRERMAMEALGSQMRQLADDMNRLPPPGAKRTVARSEIGQLRDDKRRLLEALKRLDAASVSRCEKDKTHAHYAAIALISELEQRP